MVEIGVFERPHGTRGELTLRRFADDAADLPYRHLVAAGRELAVESWRRKGDRWLLTVTGIATREDAAALTGQVASVPRADLPPPAAGTLYACDLHGMTVQAAGKAAGTVQDLVTLPAGDYLVLDGGRLVPLRPEMVESIDMERRVLRLRLPDGLLDL